MKKLALIAAAIPALMVLGFVAQGQLSAAVVCVWVASGLIVVAFRPTGSEENRRIRFSIADLVLLTALIALSLGVWSNQDTIARWINADSSNRTE
jgi:hypothetical protein